MGRIELGLVAPQMRAVVHIQREHIIGAGDHVEHALIEERLALAGVLRAGAGAIQVRAPLRLQRP